MSAPLRVLIAAGGTGGHFYPGLAVLDAMRARADVAPHFVGTARGIEARVVPTLGYPLTLLGIAPLNGVRGAALARALGKLPGAALGCLRLLREFRPDVVLSVGGYAAGPIAATAVLRGVPLAVIEPNAVPGLTHRLVGRGATRAFLAYEETARYFRRGSARVYGNPVRRAFLERAQQVREGARAEGGAHVLVLGGSQGARAINRAMPGAVVFAREAGAEFTVTHQTGVADHEAVAREYEARGVAAEVAPFIDDVASAMARADLVVCRAGAGTVSELCVMGRPALYVPLPTAADDHQRKNAEAMASRGAAVCLEQKDLSDATLGAELRDLLADRARLSRMAEQARRFGAPDAADRIADEVLALARRP